MESDTRTERGRAGRLKARPRAAALEHDLILRLSRAEGQLRGVRKMIEERAYCIDVLQQLSAARRAIDKTALILLRDHLRTCVAEALCGGARGEAAGDARIDELIEALDRFLA
ncbi:MAG TPA: metal-sensitive transcriptional regulator [Candidatus Binataceae bacterium]|nr:metal-sensitive transcriptional regulator [Candidatus Binataceae bacterium]